MPFGRVGVCRDLASSRSFPTHVHPRVVRSGAPALSSRLIELIDHNAVYINIHTSIPVLTVSISWRSNVLCILKFSLYIHESVESASLYVESFN